MNFGYIPRVPEEFSLLLLPEEEGHRFSARLYYHIGKSIGWENADVLKISSGRVTCATNRSKKTLDANITACWTVLYEGLVPKTS
jgi:hypothetical protein